MALAFEHTQNLHHHILWEDKISLRLFHDLFLYRPNIPFGTHVLLFNHDDELTTWYFLRFGPPRPNLCMHMPWRNLRFARGTEKTTGISREILPQWDVLSKNTFYTPCKRVRRGNFCVEEWVWDRNCTQKMAEICGQMSCHACKIKTTCYEPQANVFSLIWKSEFGARFQTHNNQQQLVSLYLAPLVPFISILGVLHPPTLYSSIPLYFQQPLVFSLSFYSDDDPYDDFPFVMFDFSFLTLGLGNGMDFGMDGWNMDIYWLIESRQGRKEEGRKKKMEKKQRNWGWVGGIGWIGWTYVYLAGSHFECSVLPSTNQSTNPSTNQPPVSAASFFWLAFFLLLTYLST